MGTPAPAPLCGGVLTIDLDALAKNYRLLCAKAKPAETAAVVKANAYGLGVEKIAPTLYQAGCRIFFVAQLMEAIALKPHLPADAAIAVLNGVFPGEEAFAAQEGFIPVLNSLDAIKRFVALCHALRQKLPAMIQIDTGMARLGLDEGELEILQKNPEIFDIADIRLILSHLASGDETSNSTNATQLERIKKALALLPKRKTALANSGGIEQGADYHFGLVRPGIALYGVDPLGKRETEFKPVITLSGRVIQSRHVKAGQAVGYGGTFIMKRAGVVTTIGVGYADGWHRVLSNKGAAFIKNRRVPIIGRVSMDSITLDTTDLPDIPQEGDLVELIGPNQTLEMVAQDAGTIAYEVLTSLKNRYQRRYLPATSTP